jgi:hypothetical protein
MKVVIKKPNEPATAIQIDKCLITSELNRLIGDYFCIAANGKNMFDNGSSCVVYCADSGLLNHLPLNFYRPTDHSPIVGPVVAVKTDSTGEAENMTDAEAQAVAIMLDTWARYSEKLDNQSN